MFPGDEIIVNRENKKSKKQKEADAMLGHKKGCNCKKTRCRKKYCECFNAGVPCSYLCKCEGCENGPCVKDHGIEDENGRVYKAKYNLDLLENEYTVKKKAKTM